MTFSTAFPDGLTDLLNFRMGYNAGVDRFVNVTLIRFRTLIGILCSAPLGPHFSRPAASRHRRAFCPPSWCLVAHTCANDISMKYSRIPAVYDRVCEYVVYNCVGVYVAPRNPGVNGAKRGRTRRKSIVYHPRSDSPPYITLVTTLYQLYPRNLPAAYILLIIHARPTLFTRFLYF